MKHQRDTERDAVQAKDYPLAENSRFLNTSLQDREHDSILRRVSVGAAAGTIVIAFFGLFGYTPGLGLLGSFGVGYIPIAPSTAVSFIVLAGVLLVVTLRSPSGATLAVFGVLAMSVLLFGLLEVAGYYTGRDLSFEDVLVPNVGYLDGIPIARMSPTTGAAFILGGLAVFVLVLRRGQTHERRTSLGHWGGILGSLVLGIGFIFCLSYFFGSPLFYGQGATIPMALPTALAFIMMGVATVAVSGKDAIPLSLLAAAKLAGKPMSTRRRFVLLALIMVGACAMVMAVMTVILYRYELQQHREMLQVTAQSQARLIEAIARHEAKRTGIMIDDNPETMPFVETLRQIVDAHEHYEGFEKTGEFTLARREGDSIAFVLRHRHGVVKQPKPVPFESDLAEPMHRALEGLSGTVVGLDYRGVTVLAAYEPVDVLNLGIVAKIDLSEVRAPFIRAGLAAAGVAFIVVLAGTGLFFRVANPMIARLEAYSRDLKEEVEQRKQTELDLKSSKAFLERIIQYSPFAMWITDEKGTVLRTNRSLRESLKLPDEKIIGKYNILNDDNMVTQGVASQVRAVFEKLEPTRFTIAWTGKKAGAADFENANDLVIDASMFPIVDNDGSLTNVVCQWVDVTERRRAENALRDSEEHLRLKLDTLLSPDVDIEDSELSNVFDMQALQALMDSFSKLTGIDVNILDLKENMLLTSGLQDICTRFHRLHPFTCRACSKSDIFFTADIKPNEFVAYKCPNHLWDMATPLMIGDKQVGNIHAGPFFYDDEVVDRQVFIDLAKRCGFDMEPYLEALDRVPHISREKAEHIMEYLVKFSKMISKLSYSNVKLAKAIYEQKQAKEVIEESERKLREAQQLAHLGYWYWDVKTGDLEWSDEVYKVFQLSPEEFTPQIDSIVSLLDWSDKFQNEQELIQRATESREQVVFEPSFRRSDGSTGYIFSTFRGIYNDDDELIAIRGIMQDVTEQKQAEAALRISEEKYRGIFETQRDAIFIVDLDTKAFIGANQQASVLVGRPIEELIGKPFTIIHSPEMREYALRVFRKLDEDDNAGEQEFFVTHKDGTRIPVSIIVTHVQYEGKRAMLGHFRDITERKLVEAEREALIGKLEAQNAELERFAYTVSHDLKSPLITIKGFLGMLQQDLTRGDSEPVQEDLARISNAADKMNQLLKDLLELSRIGRLVNPPEDIPLAELAHEALAIVGGQIKEKGVQVEISTELPMVFGDRLRLLEVFQNLIDNAVKYMGDQSRPRIEIGSRVDGNETIIYVRDNGIGIDPNYQEKVFGLFDQLDPTMEGSGIGLALVKRIVEVHGGRVWVESEGPGHGSTACFTIPAKSAVSRSWLAEPQSAITSSGSKMGRS